MLAEKTANIDIEAEADSAVASDSLENLYFNSVITRLSSSDVTLILRRNERNVMVLNCSFTVAKTTAQTILELIKRLEERTGQDIMDSRTIGKKLQEGDGA